MKCESMFLSVHKNKEDRAYYHLWALQAASTVPGTEHVINKRQVFSCTQTPLCLFSEEIWLITLTVILGF